MDMNEFQELGIEERRQKITSLINSIGKVKVTDLSDKFGASEVTIRNDLKELEKAGVLERVHGGAVAATRKYHNLNFYERQDKNSHEKKQIAIQVASMIEDGQTLLINSGTTTYFIACELKNKKNLKVVTNSIPISLELGESPNIDVILLGGSINTQYSFCYGDDTINQLKKYKADKLILSVDGISAEAGITTYHSFETELNRAMIDRAGTAIVVADFMKIGRESFSHIDSIEKVDILITNKKSNLDDLIEIEKSGVEIIQV